MAVKKRVFQVAREFSVSNEALIEYLNKLGYDVRNHMSPLSDEVYEQVVKKFGVIALPEEDAEHEFRRRLRDKKVQDEERKKNLQAEIENKVRISEEIAKDLPKRKKLEEEEKAAKAAEKARLIAEKEVKEKAETKAAEEKSKIERPKRPKKKLKIVEIPPEDSRRIREKPRPQPVEVETEVDENELPETESTDGKKTEKPAETEDAKKGRRRGKKKKDQPEAQEVKDDGKHKKSRRKKKKRPELDNAEIEKNIRQTMQNLDDSGKGKRRRRRSQEDGEFEVDDLPVIRVSEFISLSELAKLMDAEASELIKKCMELGMMVSINQRLDMDTITLLASEYEYEVEALAEFGEDIVEELQEIEDAEEDLQPRPPVVTIMGHVDHGKTSLLDQIRNSNIIAGESGGITQHIGAYDVRYNGEDITFIDTPGHEAFTAMRARGALVTDIVVLIVAADDNVMPQTIEAISHAKAANVPIVVAINKIDKPNANPDLIRTKLSEHGVLVEQWGGKYQSAEISAKSGQNIEHLLELILLEAELLNLRANPNRNAKGTVIETRLDKGKGVVATVLVQTGTLKIGDPFIAGTFSGKVRNMLDERNHRSKIAGPSVPVQVLGFDGMPQAGDSFMVLNSERDTKEISNKRQVLQREHERWRNRPRSLDEISKQIQRGKVKNLSLLIKADFDGSVEAIADSLLKLTTDEVGVAVIHKGVGAISESDVLLASASSAIVIGFNVRPTTNARELASKEKVDIRSYDVIYDIVDDVKSALEGFLEPHISEELVGTVEVRETFKVPKIGVIAGCYVLSGTINRNAKMKLYRDDRLIHDGKISSLRRFKDDVKEVASGFECGIGLERFDDIKVNDVIEAFRIVETKRKL